MVKILNSLIIHEPKTKEIKRRIFSMPRIFDERRSKPFKVLLGVEKRIER